MDPNEFKKQWTTLDRQRQVPFGIIRFPPKLLKKYPLSETDQSYLTAGIPKQAPPALRFDPECLALEGFDPHSWIKKDHACIGDDATDNLITINYETRNVILWDHPYFLREHYLAKDLETFLSFLLIFREFCDECDRNEEQARSNLNNYINRMVELDPSERWKAYWLLEYQMMLED